MFTKVKGVLKFMRSRRRFSSEIETRKSNGQINTNLKISKELNIVDQERTTKNEEDVTIIWLTKNLKNVHNQSLILSIQSINDYIQVNKTKKKKSVTTSFSSPYF